jgi:hypothetical protein
MMNKSQNYKSPLRKLVKFFEVVNWGQNFAGAGLQPAP